MSLVTLADYKTALKVGDASEDAKLTQYSLEIDARVKAFLGYDIEEAEYTNEIYDGTGDFYLYPREIPITAVSNLEVYQGLNSDDSEDWEAQVQGTDYDRLFVSNGGAIICLSGAKFPKGMQNIRLDYTAGYTSETLPQDIQAACKELMFVKYQGIDKQKLGTTSKTRNEGGVSSTVTFENIEDEILNKIRHYQLIRV